MKRKRSEKTAELIAKIFFGLVCTVLVLNIVLPDKKTSLSENRPLQQFPKYSNTDLVNGEYFSSIQNWFSDQFVFRGGLINLKYLTSKLTGAKEISDVYLGKDSLMEKVSEINEEQLSRNINAINSFCTSHGVRSGFMLVSNAANIQKDKLPRFASGLNQDKQIDEIFSRLDPSIAHIDSRDILKKHKDEYLYYHSDHHWTSLGAYYGYSTLASAFELGETKISDYNVYPVHNSFEGTLAHKVGSINIKDEIDIYVPKDNPEYIVTYETDGTRSRSIYSSKALDGANPYETFLGGNHGLIQIEMDNESNRHLLLFKDSYANAMIQYLIPKYRTITIVDPRYYFDDVERLFRKNLTTDVLFLYNMNTFAKDTSLADVLGY